MKKLLPSLLILIASLSISSQTLRPTIKDSLLCFTSSQCKEIAKRVELLESCTAQTKELENEISILDTLVLNKDKQIAILKSEIFNFKEIYKTSGEISNNLKLDLNECNKQKSNYKLYARVGLLASLVFGIVAIVK